MSRKPMLSLEAVVEAALQVVDEEGLAALSMRRLGRSLGVQAMSLYRHVGSKDELLDALQARILSEMSPPPATDDWAAAVQAHAHAFRSVLAAHPQAIPVFTRPASPEVAYDAVVGVVRVLVKAGLDELRALLAFQALLAFVVGQALWQFDPAGERAADDEFDFGMRLLVSGLRAELDALPATS